MAYQSSDYDGETFEMQYNDDYDARLALEEAAFEAHIAQDALEADEMVAAANPVHAAVDQWLAERKADRVIEYTDNSWLGVHDGPTTVRMMARSMAARTGKRRAA
jgi:hypothetical protein